MIGSLEGTIDFLNSPYAIVKVGGVGYKVLLPATLISRLKINQKINLFTYTYVREDALELFGFESFENLKLFENLIGISGIGPKTAINIFSFGDKNEIVEAIIKADVDFFTAIPRLGKKNAQRIIIELKSKMGGLGDLDLTEEDRKAFDKYREENKDKPIGSVEEDDAKKIKAASNELKLQKRDYKYDEPDESDLKRKIAESLPRGRLGIEEDPPDMDLDTGEMQKEIAKLKAEVLEKLQPLEIRRDKQVNALFAFANPHKVRLTLRNRTIELGAGVFGWRMTTPRVEMRKDDDEMIKLFKRTGNAQFIRIKEEIDRQALLAEKPVISGVSYIQNDEFFVVPNQIGKKPKTLTKAIDR